VGASGTEGLPAAQPLNKITAKIYADQLKAGVWDWKLNRALK